MKGIPMTLILAIAGLVAVGIIFNVIGELIS